MNRNYDLSEDGVRVRLLLDSAAEAIGACDSTGTCLFANCSAARMLEYSDSAQSIAESGASSLPTVAPFSSTRSGKSILRPKSSLRVLQEREFEPVGSSRTLRNRGC